MLIEDFTPGTRVRLIQAIDAFNVGSFPAHAAGTVLHVEPAAVDEPAVYILMDDEFPSLHTWDNVLHVYRANAEIVPALFEPAG